MELTPLLMYEAFILAIGISAVVAFSMFYFRLLKGYNQLRVDRDHLKKELDEYGNLLSATSKEQIQKIIDQSAHLSEDLKNDLSKLLSSQAQKESGAYEHVIAEVGKELERESKVQVQEFATSLKNEVTSSEEEIRGKIAKLYEDASTEVEKMRQDANIQIKTQQDQAKKELSEHIYAIVSEVVSQTTGKLLSKEDHEGIVVEELHDAFARHGQTE
ncbi:MAG: hypothetical protein ABI758_02195 [Candidatus Woesebacteria bacterium]